MAKATIGRLFWGSLVTFASALVLLAAAGGWLWPMAAWSGTARM